MLPSKFSPENVNSDSPEFVKAVIAASLIDFVRSVRAVPESSTETELVALKTVSRPSVVNSGSLAMFVISSTCSYIT